MSALRGAGEGKAEVSRNAEVQQVIRYALLALLRERRDYGYRLKRRFEERVGAVWRLNIGQVYQTLRALERAGLIVEVPGARTKAAGRRVFQLTAKGERLLDRWLQRPLTRPRPLRDEMLIRLLVIRGESRERTLARIGEQERAYKRHLSRLVAYKRRSLRDGAADVRFEELGIEAALLHGEAHLRWLEHCRRAIETGEPEAPVPPSRPARSRRGRGA